MSSYWSSMTAGRGPGDVIETSNPGGEVDKSQYDGPGRLIEHCTTDGASGTSWSAAGSATGDNGNAGHTPSQKTTYCL
jgi:YD repeat-containing protein